MISKTKSEKIVNAQGERVEICIDFLIDRYTFNGCEYRVRDLLITQPRKRKGKYLSDEIRDRWDYRNLPYDKRDEYVKTEFLKHVTEERIMDAVQKMYASLAPTDENITYHIS